LNWYAKVGTYLDVQRSICSAGQAKLASESSALKASAGLAKALSGYSAATKAAFVAGTPKTEAIVL
jgi:hypothetical protein